MGEFRRCREVTTDTTTKNPPASSFGGCQMPKGSNLSGLVEPKISAALARRAGQWS